MLPPFTLRRLLPVALLSALTACQTLSPDAQPDVLPPPPRAGIVLPSGSFTDTLGTIPRPVGSDDLPPMRLDTGAVEVLDAATLEVIPFERRPLGSGAGPSAPETGVRSETRGGAPVDGTFSSRFAGGARTAGQVDDGDQTFQEEVRDPEVDRDSLWRATVTWSELASARDTMRVSIPWRKIHTHLIPGRELYVRGLIWPTGAGVVARQPSEIRIATRWISIRRLSRREVRCVGGDGGQARLVATLTPGVGDEALMVTRMEIRDLGVCAASRTGIDRIAAFKYDIWNAVNRATSLGTRFFLNPGGFERP